jgi:GalNAc-alpha-(1->4)-GalNAc-alpha-(1->3)-diNAcBac-PP-undecaprenol alpha-1,4-N-acetyl-D-galactosaminyltransferase
LRGPALRRHTIGVGIGTAATLADAEAPSLRIAIVASSLGCGGMERVATLLAGALGQRGHACTLMTLGPRTLDFHAVPSGVQRVSLDVVGESDSTSAAVRNNVRAVRVLARALASARPDVVLALGDTTNVKTLIAARIAGVPVVVSERIDPTTVVIGRAWSALRRLSYSRAAAVVVQTESVRAWAERLVGRGRVEVIGNPVDLGVAPTAVERRREIVAIGRLVPQKGFDVLLRAFAEVAGDHPEWRLTICGEGPARGELTALAAQLGIADRVAMPGQVHDVRQRLRDASLFVLSSRFEGFPNALLEAMAAGIAIVATRCPSGPSEILRDCAPAILAPVDDAAALAAAIAVMLADPARRIACGRAARIAAQRFDAPAVVDVWESVLARAAAQRSR